MSTTRSPLTAISILSLESGVPGLLCRWKNECNAHLDFENTFLGRTATNEKPYRAVAQLNDDDDEYAKVRSLLVGLIDPSKPPP